MRYRAILISVAITLGLLGLSMAHGLQQKPEIPVELIPATSIICYEDMPCWDCQTMGDLVCGPEEGRTP